MKPLTPPLYGRRGSPGQGLIRALPGDAVSDESQPPRLPDPPPPAGGPIQHSPAQAATNGMAVASLILGIIAAILGILLFPLGIVCGILAIVFGFVGKGNAARTGAGRGMAMAGIVLGIVGIVLALLWIVFIIAVNGNGVSISPSPAA
jgi:hypothetical protein